MSLLENQVTLKGLRGEITVNALFDSGASYSCIRKDVAEKISVLDPMEEPMDFETADECAFVKAEYVIHLSFYFPDTMRRFTDEFMVLETLSEELIVGASTMQKWNIKLDFENEIIDYDRKMHRLRI